MVHDPRVTSSLARLGGVYRDPARVDRDAASLLKSSVGSNLAPITATMVENNGATSTVLVLQGTIAMHFKGQTYQLLIDMYLPAGYPNRPPVPFVRLASNRMYLKENHRHVGSDGKVYLPYLHNWRPTTHNLIELVVAMSSVFSADPPVFTRQNTSSDSGAQVDATAAATTTQLEPTWEQTQVEAIVAQEAAEANAAAEAARRAEEAEQRAAEEASRREEAAAAQKRWEEARLTQVRTEVAQKITRHLTDLSEQTQGQVQHDWRDQQRLTSSKEKIGQTLEQYRNQKEELERQLAVVSDCQDDITAWLAAAAEDDQGKSSSSSSLSASDKITTETVDDVVVPSTAVHAQMMDLSAENAAIADALYFLDKALYRGKMDCATHLKQVRKLAKRQFFVRAHLLKINQVVLKNKSNGVYR